MKTSFIRNLIERVFQWNITIESETVICTKPVDNEVFDIFWNILLVPHCRCKCFYLEDKAVIKFLGIYSTNKQDIIEEIIKNHYEKRFNKLQLYLTLPEQEIPLYDEYYEEMSESLVLLKTNHIEIPPIH